MEINCILYRFNDKLYFHVMDEQGNISIKYLANQNFYKFALEMSLYFGNLIVKDKDNNPVDIYIAFTEEELKEFKFSFRKKKELKIKDKNLFNLTEIKFQRIIWSLFDRELLADIVEHKLQ